MTFSGTVSAIPVPTGDPRVITVDICAYDGKDATGSIFSNFLYPLCFVRGGSLGENLSPQGWSVDHHHRRCGGNLLCQRPPIALCGGKPGQQRPDQGRACGQNASGSPDDSSVGAKLSISL